MTVTSIGYCQSAPSAAPAKPSSPTVTPATAASGSAIGNAGVLGATSPPVAKRASAVAPAAPNAAQPTPSSSGPCALAQENDKSYWISIGWMITALGWFITSWQANRREVRKERRSDVDACCKLTSDVLDRARKYYLSEASHDSKQVEADISFLMTRLIRRVERLGKQDAKFDAENEIGALFDRVTGGDFGSHQRNKRSCDDPLFGHLEDDAHSLMDKLEGAFDRVYTSRLELQWRNVTRKFRPKAP